MRELGLGLATASVILAILVFVWWFMHTLRERDRIECEARHGQLADVHGGDGGWVCIEEREHVEHE